MMGSWEFMILVFPFFFTHIKVPIIKGKKILQNKKNPVNIGQSRLYSENENAEDQRG